MRKYGVILITEKQIRSKPMKKCESCQAEMLEDVNLHTDYVGGYSFEEEIFVTYVTGSHFGKDLFGREREVEDMATKRVKARVCPQCGKVELYVDLNSDE